MALNRSASAANGTQGSRERRHSDVSVIGVQRAESIPVPLTRALWGIDWNDHLPIELTSDGLTAHASSYDQALPFVKEHYAAIFHEDAGSPFSTTRVNPTKERYYRLAGDFFEIKDRDRTIGLLVGSPTDWSTYYIRSAALLPEYQSRKTIQIFLEFLIGTLREAGLERVDAHTSPSNFPVVHLLTNLSFNVSGTELSDRWGAHVKLTRFLDRECEGVFLRQFCSGVTYQRAEKRSLVNSERSSS